MKARNIKTGVAAVLLAAMGCAAWAIPGYHINSDASAQKAVKQYAGNCFNFRPVVYQALLDKDTWRLALAAHDYLMKKPKDPQRECSFAEAYWQSQQVGTSENVPPSEKKKL